MKKSDLFGLFALVIFLGGLLWLIAAAPEREVAIYAPVEVPGSSLVVEPVLESGIEQVTVSAVMSLGGFVTVHQALGEAPADVIGVSSFLAPGEHSDVVIPLSLELESASSYYVLMFLDDEDGIYEPKIDLPVMVDGSVIKEKISL